MDLQQNQQGAPPYDQEIRLNNIFDELSEGFKRLDTLSDAAALKQLRDSTATLQEAKT